MLTPDCKSCLNTRVEWLDDEAHPKGGLTRPCSVCCCGECGEVLDRRFGDCGACENRSAA